MKIGWQRILSMAFLIAALGVFAAMHCLPLSQYGGRGWEVWVDIGQVILNPRLFGEPRAAVIIFSFLTFSLLIVASPFLGNVWVKSLLAWSIVVIFSGLPAAGVLWFLVLKDSSVEHTNSGMWCMMISPVLNFVGLLLARPQWLKKSGPSFPPESQAAG